MVAKTRKQKNQSFIDQSPVEILKGVGSGVVDSAIDDFGKKSINSLWEQLLGAKNPQESEDQASGNLEEGREITLSKKREKTPEGPTEPGIGYKREIIDVGKRADRENVQVINAKIQEILVELKKITTASQEIAVEFKEITIEQRIENPGEYHVTFFQWMLSLVKAARQKIEDSSSWLSVMKSKKSQRQYWNMFKKHGTTFGLSNERVVATQAG
ncbi:MAG: hypothetical protein A3B44_02020 [Candidatus Levybacteria bacterium RIFCSPLOWO2_01_FULL_38_21]|nr:MAG: hypothetical protein A3B44_02020 [Candidatus Levybacteria bacterium RIFCSPLOWO2_01_FULL_38_21]